MSKIKLAIGRCKGKVLTGTLLAIDPSIGSGSSMPGWALFQGGVLMESGIIQLPPFGAKHQRLRRILEVLQNEFEEPDIFAIEHISPSTTRWNTSLIMARAVMLAAQKWKVVLHVAPRTWRARCPKDYTKTDEGDAIQIGRACIQIAQELSCPKQGKKKS
jgi:hypothetical protein